LGAVIRCDRCFSNDHFFPKRRAPSRSRGAVGRGIVERLASPSWYRYDACRHTLGLVGCPSRPSSAPCRATAEKLLADCVSAHPRQPLAAPGARPPCGAIIEYALVRHGIRGRGGASRLCPERWRRADALPWPNGAPGWRDGRSVAGSSKEFLQWISPYDLEPSPL
jgi:hypothetical protein